MSVPLAITSRTDEKALEKERKLDALQRARDLQEILERPSGRRIFSWLIHEVTGLLNVDTTCTANTFFFEGKRAVGAKLYRELMAASPGMYVRMIDEALAAQSERELAKQTQRDKAQATQGETDDGE